MRFNKNDILVALFATVVIGFLVGAILWKVDAKVALDNSVGSYETSDGMFSAIVTEDEIVVWIHGEGERSLYWKGSWTSGKRVSSQADTVALEASLFGSQQPSKLFKVKNDTIIFEGSIMDESFKPVLKKEK